MLVVAERLSVAFDAESEASSSSTSPGGGPRTQAAPVSAGTKTETSSSSSCLSSPASPGCSPDKPAATADAPVLYEELGNINPATGAGPASQNPAASPGGSEVHSKTTTTSAPQRNDSNATVQTTSTSSSVVPGGHDQPENTYAEIPLSFEPQQQPDGTASQTAADPKPADVDRQKNVPQTSPSAEDPAGSQAVAPRANSDDQAGQGAGHPAGHGGAPGRISVVPRPAPRQDQPPPSKRASQPGLELPSVVISEPEVYTADWDCLADADNELSFQKGERLLIVSRQYEHLGWLVAQRTGGYSSRRIGLVPKNYVAKASPSP